MTRVRMLLHVRRAWLLSILTTAIFRLIGCRMLRPMMMAVVHVIATRRDAAGARQVEVPYFVTVVQGGRSVVSKRVNRVTLNFADGQTRASGKGTAAGFVNRAAATLPPEILERLTRKRKAGDMDAAIDPLSIPEVRAAVQRASFELLVGFQLTDAQLQYNATR